MSVPAPHFLLFSESRLKRKDVERETEPESVQTVGHWRFVLESLDGNEKFEADDEEPVPSVVDSLRETERNLSQSEEERSLSRSERATLGERLELLAVIRGLEALDQPSRVTLVTQSRYVSRGLRFGLEQWRESGWLWERFGEMAPVKNHDLWQRIDRALTFHQVECRTWQFEQDEASESENEGAESRPAVAGTTGNASHRASESCWTRGLPGFCRRLVGRLRQAMQPSPHNKGLADASPATPQLQA